MATGAVTWSINEAGYVAGFNQSNTATNAHGLLVKISTANETNHILTLTSDSVGRLHVFGNGRIHMQPTGTADAQLEVSDGSTTGGGTVHAASFAAHSSRALKGDIHYITEEEKARLYEDLKALRPVEFRYKKNVVAMDVRKRTLFETGEMIDDPSQPMRVGLILEDAPLSLRAEDDWDALSLNRQIFMLQAAVQVLIRKVEEMGGAK